MSGLFKNILVPVDFSVNTEAAVKQAVELACTNGSTIHLINVIKPKTMWNTLFGSTQTIPHLDDNYSWENVMIKLQQWKQSIEETIPNSKVNTYVREGIVQSQIHNAAKELQPQVIIIAKKNNYKFFNLFNSVCSNRLAKSTDCPVLSVTRRIADTKIKIIVVPVSSFIPKRKIELVVEFAKKVRAEIHLVTMPNKINKGEINTNSFLETYRLLKTTLTNPIAHHILKGNNLPRAILEYAECIRADLILVNPGSETKISNLTGKHINDALTTSSKLKILSVEPYHEN